MRSQSERQCQRCGRKPHSLQSCPAQGAVCRKCHKRGHFQVMCRSKSSGQVQQVTEETTESFFLGVVTGDSNNDWGIELNLNDKKIKFLIDTGAEVTLISETAHSQLGAPPLTKSGKQLKGPSNHSLKAKGYFEATLTLVNNNKQDVYVVKGLARCLLGQPAIESLN